MDDNTPYPISLLLTTPRLLISSLNAEQRQQWFTNLVIWLRLASNAKDSLIVIESRL